MLDHLSGFRNWCGFLPSVSDNDIIVSQLILAVGVDVRIENSETIDISDGGGYFPQSLDLLLI